MIWPFKPRSPLALPQKVNAERRFAASARLLGKHRLANCTVVVPQDFDAIIGSTDSEHLPQLLMDFVQSRFPLQDQKASVIWWDEKSDVSHTLNDAYAMQRQSDDTVEVVLHPQLTGFPYRLVSILAAACGELLVLKESLVDKPLPMGMYETLPVLFGFGPVMANAALFEQSGLDMTVEKWEASAVGTINALEYGYSMALADWSLEMSHGEVVEALRLDAKETYSQGIKFLHKTSDCYFDRNVFDVTSVQDIALTKSRLNHSSQSRRLGTVHDLMLLETIPPELAEPIAEQIRHHEEPIQVAGAYALNRCHNLSRSIHDDLLITAETASVGLKRAALTSLRPGFDNDEAVVESLTDILTKTDATTAAVCANTLLKFEGYPDNLEAGLLKALSRMVLKSGPDDLKIGLQLLKRISDSPLEILNQHFDDDPSAKSIFEQLLTEMDAGEG